MYIKKLYDIQLQLNLNNFLNFKVLYIILLGIKKNILKIFYLFNRARTLILAI
jgi:hypothetical protein